MKKKINKMLRIGLSGWLSVLVAFAMSGLVFVHDAKADDLTLKSDTMSRLEDATLSDHQVDFKTHSGVDASTDDITIVFTGFTMGTVDEGDVDLEIDAACDGTYEISKTIAAAAGASPIWGAAFAGTTLTLTAPTDAAVGEIAVDACVRVEVGENADGGAANEQITNPGISTPTIAIAGAFGDDGDIVVAIIDDDSVNVKATVDESIAFTIGGDMTMEFGTLDNTAVQYADTSGGNATDVEAHNMTVATNASGGYIVTYEGATLTSPNSDEITVASSIATGGTTDTEQFAMALTTDGNATITAAYDHTTPLWTFSTTSQPIQIISDSATATETFGVHYLANISGLTEAGEYSTDITYIATATF